MNSDELKQMQAPLKSQYRENPDSAMVTLKAQSRLGEGITCKIETGKAMVTAGLHPATGGNGFSACSGEMLLEALAACAGVTLNSVATAIGVELSDAVVQVEGDLDFRGTLGVSKETPVGFAAIRMRFQLQSTAEKALLDKLIQLTERYCVVYQTLKAAPLIEDWLPASLNLRTEFRIFANNFIQDSFLVQLREQTINLYFCVTMVAILTRVWLKRESR